MFSPWYSWHTYCSHGVKKQLLNHSLVKLDTYLKWNHHYVITVCFSALSCGFPYNINNVVWMTDGYTEGSTAMLKCWSGYYQTTIVTSCSATRSWVAVNSTCIPCKFNQHGKLGSDFGVYNSFITETWVRACIWSCYSYQLLISVYSTDRLLEYSVNLYKSLDSSHYGYVYNNDVSKRFDIYHLPK
jgi:hypothetical protein